MVQDTPWLWHENIDVRSSVMEPEAGTDSPRLIVCRQDVAWWYTDPTEMGNCHLAFSCLEEHIPILSLRLNNAPPRFLSARWAFSERGTLSSENSGYDNALNLVRGFHFLQVRKTITVADAQARNTRYSEGRPLACLHRVLATDMRAWQAYEVVYLVTGWT